MSSTGGGEGRWFDGVGEGPGGPGGQPQWSPDPSTPQGPGAGDAATPTGSRRGGTGKPAGRRRPPLWLLILLGVVVVGAVVTLVLLLTQQEDDPEVPPAETVTLPVPTPTIDAIGREPGTPFFEALPSEVLQFALTEAGEDQELLQGGALEAYRLVYSDGGADTLTVLAGQWRDAAGPQARLDSVLAQLGEVPEASDVPEPTEPAEPAETAEEDGEATEDAAATPTEEPVPSAEQGPVQVDGQDVGRYVFVPREDGTGTIWWTNATVFIQLDGPWAELRDVFTAYPL